MREQAGMGATAAVASGSVTGAAGQRGMSLLEILLGMALIAATGLLAAGILTGGLDRSELRSTAREIAASVKRGTT